ncbi:RNA 2',3'-cyclic phosphodiesterase [Desulfurobacterium sp.]
MKKRLFIGTMIKIPSGEIKEIRNEIDKMDILGKWVKEENLHFTYRFLGEIPYPSVLEISKNLEKALKNVKKIEAELKGLGVFPNNKTPRILWISVNAPGIKAIKNAVDESLKPVGFKKENKEFIPHVTILRIKKFRHRIKFSNYLNRMKEHLFLKTTIQEVSLIESILTSDGPIYKKLETVKLL